MKSFPGYSISFLIVIGCAAILTVLAVLLPYVHWHSLSGEKEMPAALISQLKTLGKKSLRSYDVPVAAVLIYRDSIIGEGYNTVLRDNSAGGHAEINALSSAMQRIGPTAFSQLNRDSLVLVSTFEPCAMCTGAMLEYRIKHIRYMKPKPILSLLQENLRAMRYRWQWEQRGPEAVQDSLFFSHPGYRVLEQSR